MRADMRFPIIEIVNNSGNQKIPRIVGTDSHDVLELDEATGGIHYINLQCQEDTRRYRGGKRPEGFSFVAEDEEWGCAPIIRMVSFEELCEIYLEQMQQSLENEKKMRAFIREIEAKRNAMIKDFEKSEEGKTCLTAL